MARRGVIRADDLEAPPQIVARHPFAIPGLLAGTDGWPEEAKKIGHWKRL
jgi:hypothetical protein